MASCDNNNRIKYYQNVIIGFKFTFENVGDVFLRHSVVSDPSGNHAEIMRRDCAVSVDVLLALMRFELFAKRQAYITRPMGRRLRNKSGHYATKRQKRRLYCVWDVNLEGIILIFLCVCCFVCG